VINFAASSGGPAHAEVPSVWSYYR